MDMKERRARIDNLGVLDLTRMSPEDLDGLSEIANVGVVVVPESLSGKLMSVTQSNVGSIVVVPEVKGKLKIHSGQMMTSGKLFANEKGSPDDVLLVMLGEIFVTSPIEQIGYTEIYVGGNLIVPQQSAELLSEVVTTLITGQIIYYQGENPRIYSSMGSLSKAFFELADQGTSLVITGDYELEDDVEAELLKEKISELVIAGRLTAPKKLIPYLQWSATITGGVIRAKEESEDNRSGE